MVLRRFDPIEISLLFDLEFRRYNGQRYFLKLDKECMLVEVLLHVFEVDLFIFNL